MPTAIAKSALPPITTSRVCEMYSNAPASGAATQGPTIRALSAPIANTPPSLPPVMRPEALRDARLPGRTGVAVRTAEHRQRQRDEQGSEQREYPRLLQRSRQPFACKTGGDAESGVDDRHAERVGEREHEAPRLGEPLMSPPLRSTALPTMIDDRIGTIGSTHGVKLSSRPSTKKIGSTVEQRSGSQRGFDATRSVGVVDAGATDARALGRRLRPFEAAPSVEKFGRA